MSRPRLFATAVFAAPFPIILLTGALQQIPALASTALLLVVLVAALLGAGLLRPDSWPWERLSRVLADISPTLGLAAAAVSGACFLALELASYALAGLISAGAEQSLLRSVWPVAALWLATTVLGWWRWRSGGWNLACLLLPVLGLWLLLWLHGAVTEHVPIGLTGPGWPPAAMIGGGLLLVVLAGTLAYSDATPERRAVNHIVTGATAIILAGGYLFAILNTFRYLGPGPLGGDGPPPGVPYGPGPIGFATAQTALDGIYQAVGGGVVSRVADVWQWPLLAAIATAVILFGRAATDRADALHRAFTGTANGARLHPRRPARLLHALLSAGGAALVISGYPQTLLYVALTAGTLGLAAIASFALVAVAVDGLIDAGTWPVTKCWAASIASLLPLAAFIGFLPRIPAWSWRMPQLWAIPGGYLAIAAVTTVAAVWLRRYRRSAYERVSQTLIGPAVDPYRELRPAGHRGWTLRDGSTVRVGDTVQITMDEGQPAEAVIEAVDTDRRQPVLRLQGGSLAAVDPLDIRVPAAVPAGW